MTPLGVIRGHEYQAKKVYGHLTLEVTEGHKGSQGRGTYMRGRICMGTREGQSKEKSYSEEKST